MPINKFSRLMLAATILMSLVAGARAQESRLPTLTNDIRAVDVPSLPPVLPPSTAIDEQTLATAARPVALNYGVLVQTTRGEMVLAEGAEKAFNPASAIKLATALAALRAFGPQHRFSTAVWTTGTFDAATGVINGDLIVSGRDPSFHYEHAVMLARELNRLGIRSVTGNLIIPPRFTMNFSSSSLRSGEQLYDTLDLSRRPAAATRAWFGNRQAANDAASLQSTPSVAVLGAVYVDSVPAGARVLLTHKSSALVDILKVLLCYSNNFMAERIGDAVGGTEGLQRLLINDLGIPASEVRVASTSGLGVNRLTPRGMMKVYQALRDELAEHNLGPSDIMPVAGIDPGTLQKRFQFHPSRGSIIAKTGTLPRTDGGASALVGQMRAQNGETLLFVIFNQRGSVGRFRQAQDRLVSELQNARGGPKPFVYTPLALALRLADTELQPFKSSEGGEYESLTPN